MYIDHKPGEHVTKLATRGPIEPEDPRPSACHEVIAWLAEFEAGHNQYGYDRVNTWLVRKCFDGTFAVLVQRDWRPALGYCAEGEREDIYPLAAEAQPSFVPAQPNHGDCWAKPCSHISRMLTAE